MEQGGYGQTEKAMDTFFLEKIYPGEKDGGTLRGLTTLSLSLCLSLLAIKCPLAYVLLKGFSGWDQETVVYNKRAREMENKRQDNRGNPRVRGRAGTIRNGRAKLI